MTILPSNIRLLESERMADTSDGGGRRTNRVIPDGVAGNVFPKVSRVDSVYGRVNLRKIFPHINTASLDVYAGAHFIITDAPDNDRISVLAFSTGSDFDQRTAARDRIESYVIAGPESRATLYGRQLQGSQAILLYQRVEEPLPEIGDVYAISNEVGGVTTAQQFVRVQDVTHEVRTFTEDASGEFQRRVVTLKIGAPLRYEFSGIPSPSRFGSVAAAVPGRLRSTTVADASRYYGIQPVSEAVPSGALELLVDSVYAPIVPTTQREAPLSLVSLMGASTRIKTGTGSKTIAFSPAADRRASLVLPRGVLPGTVNGTLVAEGVTGGTWAVADSGTGILRVSQAGVESSVITLSVNYETGVVQFATTYTYSSWQLNLTALDYAVEVQQTAHTKAIEITLATRGTVYSLPLLPIPAPGTLVVEYRALGKWYRLRDNGAGELVGGDAAYGTGSVDYVTGGAVATLGALPDVGSSVLWYWSSPVHYQILAATPGNGFDIALDSVPVKPGSMHLAWDEDGVAKTASDNGAGLIAGDATGAVVYQAGRLKLALSKPIAGDVTITYDRDTPPTTQAGFDFGGPVAPHSVNVSGVGLTLPNGLPYTGLTLVDNGAGVLIAVSGLAVQDYIGIGGYYMPITQSLGTVNYSTGVITVASSVPMSRLRQWNSLTNAWEVDAAGSAAVNAAGATFAALPTSATPDIVAQTKVATLGTAGVGLSLQLGPATPMTTVPGSVLFTAFGKTYVDRNGVIYTDLSPTTGSGTAVGSINYETGAITLNDYPSATTSSFVIVAALGRKGDYTSANTFFRTAGSPVRPASLFVQVTAADGELLTGTTDQDGNVTGSAMVGKIEQTMGVVSLSFGSMVTAAGNEAEPWYDPANVVGGLIWKPRQVLPGTLRYSAVVLSNLPLNADILGLDPVRLPSDGRVPIFRPADVAVVHHTASYNAGTPAAGASIDVGRTGLSVLWLEDANKKKLADSLFAADFEAGVVTMAADLDLTGYVTPIAVRHRIEEMVLISDVQINGLISFTAPLLRAFPSGSYLSSALLYGDLQARATNLFDQQTWTGVWQGSVIGSGATAQYNDLDYPVQVLNNGAITERWRINFTSTTGFQVIGESMGVIATGTTGVDLQPVNPLTSLPFFTLRAAGWGIGWAAGNQLRFDTIAAAPPTWLARTVLPGAALTGDSFDAQMRGDVD
nr:hypothetical protein [uncultured Acidovorax sp.]